MSDFTKPSREKRRPKRTWKRQQPKKNAPKLAGRRDVENQPLQSVRETALSGMVQP
jgi:hypothetical protein